MSVVTQTTYNQGYRIGAPGDLADDGPKDVLTVAAAEAFKAGKFVTWKTGDSDKKSIRNLKQNKLTIDLGGDIASGSIAGTLRTTDLEGNTIDTAISVAFNSDHDTTMDDFKTAVDAITDVSSTLTDSGGDNRVLEIVATGDKSIESYVDFTATGLSPSETAASTDVPCGITGIDRTKEKNAAGEVSYIAGDEVPLIRLGKVFMDAESALATTATLYARFAAGTGLNEEAGTVRNSAGSSPVVAVAVAGLVSVDTPSTAVDQTVILDVNLKGAA